MSGFSGLPLPSPLPQHPPEFTDRPALVTVSALVSSPIDHVPGVPTARGNGTGRRRCVRLQYVGDGRRPRGRSHRRPVPFRYLFGGLVIRRPKRVAPRIAAPDILKPARRSTPARSTNFARPATENGAPRSLTNINGDLASRFSARS